MSKEQSKSQSPSKLTDDQQKALDKVAADKKAAADAAEKPNAIQKARTEHSRMVATDKAEFHQRLRDDRAKRKYVPKPKSGKHFHLNIENATHDPKSGEKRSNGVVQIMDVATVGGFMKNASRHGFAVAVLHDPVMFYGGREAEIKKAFNAYAESVTMPTFKYAVSKDFYYNRTPMGDALAKAYEKRAAVEIKQQEKKESLI